MFHNARELQLDCILMLKSLTPHWKLVLRDFFNNVCSEEALLGLRIANSGELSFVTVALSCLKPERCVVKINGFLD